MAVALREAAQQLTIEGDGDPATRIPGATLPVPTFALDEEHDARPLSGETFAPGELAGGPSVVIEAPTRPVPTGFSASRRWLLTFALGFGLLLGIGVPVGLWGSGALAPKGGLPGAREQGAAGPAAGAPDRAAAQGEAPVADAVEPSPAEPVPAQVPAPILAKAEPPSKDVVSTGRAVAGRVSGSGASDAGTSGSVGIAPPVAKPIATPTPVPVASPPAAVEVAAPPPGAGPASFKAAGDAEAVFLVAGGKRYPPGEVPAGTYTIEASFSGQAPTAAGTITLAAGQSATVKCNGSFMKCK